MRGRKKGVKNKRIMVKDWMYQVKDGEYTLEALSKLTQKSTNTIRRIVKRYKFALAGHKKRPKLWKWDSSKLVNKLLEVDEKLERYFKFKFVRRIRHANRKKEPRT